MRELPSPTTEIVCETLLFRKQTVPVYKTLLERFACGKIVVSKSSQGFTQDCTEDLPW